MVDLKSAPKGTSTVVNGVTLVSGGDGKTYSPNAFERTFGYAPPMPVSPSGISQSGQGPIVSPAGQVLYAGDPYPGTNSSLYQTVYVPGYGNITPAEAARTVPPPSSPVPPPPSPVQSSTSTNTLSSVRSQPRGTSATQDGVTAISGGNGRTYSPRAYERTFGNPPPQPTYISAPQGAGAAAPAAQRYSATRITPPSVGSAGMMASTVGPAGRTFAQVTGKDYLSHEERLWYLAQLGKTVDAAGNIVPLQQAPQSQQAATAPVGPAGRTVAQIRGTAYRSPEERTWYFQQLGQTPPPVSPAPAQPAPTRAAPSGNAFPAESVLPPTYLAPASGGGVTVDLRFTNLPQAGVYTLSPEVVGAIQAAFPPSEWTTAYYVAAAESGGNPTAQNLPEQTGLPNAHTGIFQISDIHGYDREALKDPYVNAQAAAQIWRQSQGWGRVSGNPWQVAPYIFSALGR